MKFHFFLTFLMLLIVANNGGEVDASETQSHDKPKAEMYFFEKDLFYGTRSNLKLITAAPDNDVKFLPNADSIPLSSSKIEFIINKMNIKKGSEGARSVKNTITKCEEEVKKGSICVTSLESMVDFIISKLGKNVEAFSTQASKDYEFGKYRVLTQEVEMVGQEKNVVVCHKEDFPYGLFYCHKTDTTRVYFVPLEGVDGSRAKAITVCHTDTSDWNPNILPFKVLKVKPGAGPICHLLPIGHLAWISK